MCQHALDLAHVNQEGSEISERMRPLSHARKLRPDSFGDQVPVHEPPPDHHGHDVLHLPDRVEIADVVPARELVYLPL